MEALKSLMTPTENWIHGANDPSDTISFVSMLLLCLGFGGLYKYCGLYFRDNEPRDASLGRSLTILTPTLMTIFWIVSSTRFRLDCRYSELCTFRHLLKELNISFIILALACAISCAIFEPLIAYSSACSLYACLRNLSPASNFFKRFAVVTYNTSNNSELSQIETILRKAKCRHYEFVSARTYDGMTSYVFNISNLQPTKLQQVTQLLEQKDRKATINVFYPNGRISA